ncbi:hypothetical protein SCP_0409720 [Sparassis crispa]|uniref:KOW domain-containing protein n=1 Tax=Sparassis crispa TaxID=139825 RepID=A0A401GK94_9APHY|nr:hypothetical protein SCP_0409720 [Sparassis crispa]GBE82588.1 hypothetical protein SCP_0409720 [Sparassis crispa]
MPPALLKELFGEAVTESEGDRLIHILKGKKFKGGLLQLELTLDRVTFDIHATRNDVFVFNAAKFVPKTAIAKLILFCVDFELAAGTRVIVIQGEQCGLIGVMHSVINGQATLTNLYHEKLDDELSSLVLPVTQLHPLWAVGDAVKVKTGLHAGLEGQVIAVDDFDVTIVHANKVEHVCSTYDDASKY